MGYRPSSPYTAALHEFSLTFTIRLQNLRYKRSHSFDLKTHKSRSHNTIWNLQKNQIIVKSGFKGILLHLFNKK